MSDTITKDIPALQSLIRELGLSATTVRAGEHRGFGKHKIIVDWNGDDEEFDSVEDAEKEIRAVAKR